MEFFYKAHFLLYSRHEGAHLFWEDDVKECEIKETETSECFRLLLTYTILGLYLFLDVFFRAYKRYVSMYLF